MQKERRFLTGELRAKRGDGGNKIGGYAAKYNVISEDLGGFREVLLPGCFDLDNSPDIVCNFDHDDCRILGRSTSGTLRVSADDVGLAFECDTPNTTLGNDIVELIARGDIASNSFAFTVEEEEWDEMEDGTPLRKIKRCVVWDTAVVIHPAYPETELALRSLEAARAKTQPQPEPRKGTHVSVWKRRLALSLKGIKHKPHR